jgi:hypothetical protein
MVELEFAPLDAPVADNLESTPHFGGEEPRPAEDQHQFRARIHESPIALSFRDLLTRQKLALTEKLYARFDLWLVPHRFSVLRIAGSANVTNVGCDVEYLPQGQTLSIISLIPAPEFVDRASLSLGAEAKLNVHLSETGILELASSLIDGGVPLPLPESTQSSASIKTSGDFKLNLRMNIVTQLIAAVGAGSTTCTFQFTKDREPLYNKDIETWAVIALPKFAEDIVYKIRCSFISRRLFVPRLWQTPWSELRATKGA